MVMDTLWDTQTDILSKADELAADLADQLNCDFVVISLANTERLFSFGVAGMDVTDVRARLHDCSDTVCCMTVEKNSAVVISDARTVEGILERLYVTTGKIVGYIGEPIRDASRAAIGAICAVTASPRQWSDADKLAIKQVRDETENLLAYSMMQNEVSSQSRALGDYDNIVGAIALHADAMISIHNTSGELLFATNALLNEVEPQTLEAYVRSNSQDQGLRENRSTWGLNSDGRNWHPKMRCHGNDVVFVQWDAPNADSA